MERFSEHLRAFAAHLESVASEDRAEQLASRAIARARNPQAQARRAVGVLAGIAIGAFGFLGVGALADSSVPGQFLYPVDRAFEAMSRVVGVDTGGSEERLTEAIALLDRGDEVGAAGLIDEAIEAASRETGLNGQLTDLSGNPIASTTTTTVETGPIVLPADTDNEPVIIAEAPPEPALTLRLATEALLRTVQEIKSSGGGGEAAGKLVAAASDAKAAAEQVIVLSAAEPPGESTTTTTAPEGPTTSVPAESSSTTTTTRPAGTSSTTSTSTPDDESTTTTTVPAGGSTTTTSTTEPGPIILPPQG